MPTQRLASHNNIFIILTDVLCESEKQMESSFCIICRWQVLYNHLLGFDILMFTEQAQTNGDLIKVIKNLN